MEDAKQLHPIDGRFMKPRRILYILPHAFTFLHVFRGHFSYLRSRGFQVEVVCEQDRRAKEAARREGVVHHAIRINQFPTPLQDMRALLALIRLMKERKYDIVTCDTKKGGLLACLAAKMVGVPFILYIVRGLGDGETGREWFTFFSHIERVICLGTNQVLLMSQSNLKIFQQNRVCPLPKMVVFGGGSPNGIDTTHFRKTEALRSDSVRFRQKLGIPPSAFVFGFVGRLLQEKGIPELAEAWVTIRAKYSSSHLLLISPPHVGPGTSRAIDLLRKCPNVHFTGFMKDPAVGYAAMDCLVIPSHGEGLGLVILEAGAMELPVISTTAPGCVDAVVHEQTGLQIPAGDIPALVAAMERVILEPSHGQQWGRNGRQRCEELFRQDLIWQSYADLYEQVLADRAKQKPELSFLAKKLKRRSPSQPVQH